MEEAAAARGLQTWMQPPMRLCQGLSLTQQMVFLSQLLTEAWAEPPRVGPGPRSSSSSLHSPGSGGAQPPSSCHGEA